MDYEKECAVVNMMKTSKLAFEEKTNNLIMENDIKSLSCDVYN